MSPRNKESQWTRRALRGQLTKVTAASRCFNEVYKYLHIHISVAQWYARLGRSRAESISCWQPRSHATPIATYRSAYTSEVWARESYQVSVSAVRSLMVMFEFVQVDLDFRINIGCRFMYSVQRSHSRWTTIAQYTYLCEHILVLHF